MSSPFRGPIPSGRGRFSNTTSAIAATAPSRSSFASGTRLGETYVRLQRDLDRAARAVPDARPRGLAPAGRHILYGDVVSKLRLAKAKGYTDDLYRALPHTGGVESYVT